MHDLLDRAKGLVLTPFDQAGVFYCSEHIADIQRLAVRGAGFTVFSAATGLAIQIVGTAVLARILTPEDFGLITMVTTFGLLVSNFGLVGITEAVLQRERIDHTLISNLFWINLAVGTLLTIAFAAAGSLMANFFGDRRVADVAIGMSITILLTSSSVLHLALLKRAMLFSVVSINDILARAVSVILSIALSLAGFGYWALVAGAIILSFSTSIGAWLCCQWIPGAPRRAPGTGPMIRFAISTYARFALNYFARNTDKLLVGWRFGAQPLGFYKKAYDLFALSASQTVAPLTNVAVAAFSRLTGDVAHYSRDILKVIQLFAFAGMALSASLTLIGPDLIALLLGPGWERAGRIFSLLGPGIGCMLIYYIHGWIHLSLGRPDRWLRWGIMELTVTGLLFALALSWGPEGMAVAWTISYWILLIPAFWYAGGPIQFKSSQLISAIWRYLAGSLFAGCLTALIMHKDPLYLAVSGPLGITLRIGIVSLLFVALYFAMIIVLHCGLGPFRLVGSLLEKLRGRTLPSSGNTPAKQASTPEPRLR
jgi:PST family polysaccharide transporter